MPTRHAQARWEGSLKDGKGRLKLGSGVCDAAYSYTTRFEGAAGTNPEELIGAALAGCFSMALAHRLAQAGTPPASIQTRAEVRLEADDGGFRITEIQLACEAHVPGVERAVFQKEADAAKNGCPVSRALTGAPIRLQTELRT